MKIINNFTDLPIDQCLVCQEKLAVSSDNFSNWQKVYCPNFDYNLSDKLNKSSHYHTKYGTYARINLDQEYTIIYTNNTFFQKVSIYSASSVFAKDVIFHHDIRDFPLDFTNLLQLKRHLQTLINFS